MAGFYDASGDDSNDQMVLMRDRNSSPILVRIIRALTPGGSRQRGDGNGNGGGRPGYARQSSINRVFQIVKEGLDGVRSRCSQ